MQNNYKLDFSERLRKAMIQKGHGSRSAASGASPAALCKAIDCYPEMALRYLDGRSVPSPDIVLKISKWLEIEPAYLLFGEQENKLQSGDKILIDKNILDYTLKKIIPLIRKYDCDNEIVSFFNSILCDLSLINLEPDELKKVVDLAIKSTSVFKVASGNQEHGSFKSVKATS